MQDSGTPILAGILALALPTMLGYGIALHLALLRARPAGGLQDGPTASSRAGVPIGARLDPQLGLLALFPFAFVFGTVALTLLLRLGYLAGLGRSLLALQALPCLVILVSFVALGRRRGSDLVLGLLGPRQPAWLREPGTLRRLAAGLLVVLIALKLLLPASLALTAPMLSWDGWDQWAAKALHWFHAGDLIPLDGSRGPQVINLDYPRSVSLLILWIARVNGSWNDSLISWPWPVYGACLALVLYSFARAAGGSLLGLLATLLLVSLPMVQAHIVLAGCADLPLALCFGGGSLCIYGWLTDGERRDLLGLGLAMLLCGMLTKPEGIAWPLTLLPPLLVANRRRLLAHPRARPRLFVTGLAIYLALAGGLLASPALRGRIGKLSYHPGWQHVRLFLLEQGSWNLLFFVLPLLLVLSWHSWRRDRLARLLVLHLASCGLFFYVLFFWTENYLWLQRGTAVNRVLLQMSVPLVFLGLRLAALWLRANAVTGQAGGGDAREGSTAT